jgi:hypothetical protein
MEGLSVEIIKVETVKFSGRNCKGVYISFTKKKKTHTHMERHCDLNYWVHV